MEIQSSKENSKLHKRQATKDSNGKLNGNVLIAIASSTGGPKALQEFLPMLPENLNAPIVLTQHMPKGFTKAMSDRLNSLSKVTVHEAGQGDVLEKGHVYIAPGGFHLTFSKSIRKQVTTVLSDDPPVGTLKPCANVMLESLKNTPYDTILCVVLTGMGEDGTKGIMSLGEAKDIYVISQSRETCVVYGMPKAIAEAGYSDEVLPLLSIAARIEKLVGVQ